ncbi:MAG: anti-CBASS protein Acb1 family protein [Gemmatimonadaceae bacterium]
MSGSFGTSGTGDGPQAMLGVGSALSSDLMQLLNATDIQPGADPSYQLCKTIYTSHPLGSKMADAPINMAQSQDREISIPDGPEERLKEAFLRAWKGVGVIGADAIIHNAMKTARIYGIASLAMGARGKPTDKELPRDKLHELDLYFNILDPLNTAGSLVMNQDPNAPDYQKPTPIRVGVQYYHPANTVVMLNEQPIYISWSNSAFGFVGRSVYQRALYPLKSFIQTMITDDLVAFKAGVIVAKMKAETSNANRRTFNMFSWKRQQVKTAQSGNVLGIGIDEAIESLNMQNLEQPFRLAREDILKNIATAANMPARLLDQETMVSGFGEGEEDAKQIARYIDRVRIEMQPLYAFFDEVAQRIAWSPDFYRDLQRDDAAYRKVPYETAFNQWRNSFVAMWPNLLTEPESELILVEDVRFKSVVALLETVGPMLDPENRAQLVMWAAEEINARKKLFANELNIDEAELIKNGPQNQIEEPEAEPFSYRDAAPGDAVVQLRGLIEKRKAARPRAAVR